MDTFHFFESEWETELDVRGCIRVMRQLLVIVEPVFFRSESQRLMPTHTGFLPFLEPVEFTAGAYEKLHFHLLEFTHPEDELACHDLVAESFTDLGDTERNLHTSGFLDIQEVHENALSRFGTQVYLAGAFGRRSHFRGEHQVELTHFRPVASSGYRANNLVVNNNLTKFNQIIVI